MKKIENGCQDKLDWFDGKHINEKTLARADRGTMRY